MSFIDGKKGLRYSWTDFRFFCLRVLPGRSYFDVLPSQVSAYDVEYSEACHCHSYTTEGSYTSCTNAFEFAFPTLRGRKEGRLNPSPMFLCDRQKRDIQFPDEPTDEDFHLFEWTLPLRKRHKRESGRISKANATYYCEEKISKTKIGKLCAKLGINVQALVNVCSFDVEVKCLRFSLKMRCLILHICRLFIKLFSRHLWRKAFNIFANPLPSRLMRIYCYRYFCDSLNFCT